MADALYFVHALTSVHAGTGQGIDAIDLPIARERSTTLPFLPGSTLKGCLRDQAVQGDVSSADIQAVFGPSRERAAENAGAISVSDGQLALFPVRSLAGTFVWATSPYLLARLARDAAAIRLAGPAATAGGGAAPAVPAGIDDGRAIVADPAVLLPKLGGKLVLEEYDLEGKFDNGAAQWAKWLGERIFPEDGDGAFREALQKRLTILSDRTLFSLARTATEIQAHVAIDPDKGTVCVGALWYQESLPAETVLFGLLRATAPRAGGSSLTAGGVLDCVFSKADRLQVGGKAGTGQGWVRIVRVQAGGAA